MTAAHPKERREVVEAGRLLARSGVMSHTGHINFSVLVAEDRMLLTSIGLLDEITDDTFAVVSIDGIEEAGKLSPSTREIVPMHAVVYRNRAGIHSVVHTHSPHLVAFALAHRPLPCRYEALLRRGQAGEVPVVPWGARGSEASVAGIREALRTRPDTLAVLLANHGVLAFGSTPRAAALLVVTLEEAAAAELRATALGGARDLPAGAFEDVQASMARG